VCAAYLVRGGQRVLVLEASAAPGGLAENHKFHPGFNAGDGIAFDRAEFDARPAALLKKAVGTNVGSDGSGGRMAFGHGRICLRRRAPHWPGIPTLNQGELDTVRGHLHALLGQVTLKPKDGVLWAYPTLKPKKPTLKESRPLILVAGA
jgi:hypothetical protein